MTETGDFGPHGSFSFTVHTAEVTGDHLSGPYSANEWNSDILLPSGGQGTGSQGGRH